MPSSFPCHRTLRNDLEAIANYAQSNHTSHVNREQAKVAIAQLEHYFSRYWKNFQTPRRLLPNRGLRKLSSFLFGLYGSKAAPFSYIDDLRNVEQLGACLYCGLPKNITVDHYLPREVEAFPHFSFLSLNLIPACSSCQGSKGSFYPKRRPADRAPAKAARRIKALRKCSDNFDAITGRLELNNKNRTILLRRIAAKRKASFFRVRETRRIIHPYYDRFLDRPAFDLNLSWRAEVPKIEEFLWLPHLSAPQRALLSFHMKKLKVKDRSSGHIKRVHQAFVDSVVAAELNQAQIKERIGFMLMTSRKRAGIGNSIEESYFRALWQDESKHALLAAKAAGRKQRLLPESKAVSKRTIRQRDANLYGY